MKIETLDRKIDIFPIRKVRITHRPQTTDDDFHRVCTSEVRVDRSNAIGLNQSQATLILDVMRQANTDLMGNGKEFFMVRGNNLIPIEHSSFSQL